MQISFQISKLVKKRSISKVVPCKGQFLSPFFLVDKPNGDKRFILNLKKLNEHLNPPHFKMEDWKTVIRLLTPDCFLASLDLEDAYARISIHPDFKKFLRFSFQGDLFEFNVLPFGLSTAPLVFTKIMKPVSVVLRSKGFISVNYLDDFLFITESLEECEENVSFSMKLLKSLGFVLNYRKSQLRPTKSLKFLGFRIDSVAYSINLPSKKWKRFPFSPRTSFQKRVVRF